MKHTLSYRQTNTVKPYDSKLLRVSFSPFNTGNFYDFLPENNPDNYDSIDTKVVFQTHMGKFILNMNTKKQITNVWYFV